MSKKSILVTGGARSGKSSFAEKLCEKSGEKVAYIATAQVFDDEMKARVKLHRDRRPDLWDTFESPTGVGKLLSDISGGKVYYDAILVDCLTVLTTNVFLLDEIDWDNPSNDKIDSIKNKVFDEIDQIIFSLKSINSNVIFVTNELGMGIVPENAMARAFRDIAGWVNQKMADKVDEVYFVVSGIPIKIKG